MIKVDSVKQFHSINSIKNSNSNLNNSFINNQQIIKLQGVPRSYISFKANEKTNKLRFTDDGLEFLERAKKAAQENGNKEITPYHVIKASIDETEENILRFDKESLDSGIVESISKLNKLANKYAKQNMMLTEDSREIFMQAVRMFKDENDLALSKLPVYDDTEDKDSELLLSEDFARNLNEINEKGVKIDSDILLGVAFETVGSYGDKYPVEFLKDFKSISFYESEEKIRENYMKAYDNRALEVWNKLALGSNLFVTYNDSKEADRIISSIIKTMNAPKYGGFNSKNTLLYPMSKEITQSGLLEEVNAIALEEPDKNKIFMINMDNLILSSINPKTNEYEFSAEMFGLMNNPMENTKFILLQSKDSYYQFMQNSDVKKWFSDYIAYFIPPIHTYEAQEIIAVDKKLTKNLKVPFSKDAKNKAIIYADRIDGVFLD